MRPLAAGLLIALAIGAAVSWRLGEPVTRANAAKAPPGGITIAERKSSTAVGASAASHLSPAARSAFDGAPQRGPFEPGEAALQTEFLRELEDLEARLGRGERADAYRVFSHLHRCDWNPHALRAETERCERGGKSCDPAKVQGLKRVAEQCAGIGTERIAERQRYLDLAAAWGDVRAQVAFHLFPPRSLMSFSPGETDPALRHPEQWADFVRRRNAYLEAAAARGAAPAFAALSAIHGESADAAFDPVASLAYWLAYESTRADRVNAAHRDRLAANLDAAQVREAHELRDRLLARCCR